ncbi:mariner Mos1 transposase [Trichonephila clavipes]|nr:mariner Mos1 transposase [Trichonephila clavipes]
MAFSCITSSENGQSRIKTMLITFFDSHGIIHEKFLPEGTLMNAARHIEILTRFMKRLRRVRTHYAQQGSWFCVHDNAHTTTVKIVKQFLPKKEVVQTEHPPYSSDLNPPDFFLFRRPKLSLKGKRFDAIPDNQHNITKLLNFIPKMTSCKVCRACIEDLSSA